MGKTTQRDLRTEDVLWHRLYALVFFAQGSGLIDSGISFGISWGSKTCRVGPVFLRLLYVKQ